MGLTRTVLETAPTGLSAIPVSATQINISWNRNPRDVTAPDWIEQYRLYRNGVLILTQTGLSYSDTSLTPNTPYTYTVSCVGTSGEGPKSGSLMVATPPSEQDTQAPTVPVGLSATSYGAGQIFLAWTPSTDNVGVSLYRIQRDGVVIGTSSVPNFTDTGLASGQVYVYRVRAEDAAGNLSAYSATTNGTAPSGEVLWSLASTWPGGVIPTTGSNVTIPAGLIVVLDVQTPSLGEVMLDGTLKVAGTGTYALTCTQMHATGSGAFVAGSPVAPFTGRLTVTFTGARTGNAHDRGFMLHDNARLEIYANPPAVPWTKLGANATAGQTSLTLAESVNWNQLDEIVVGTTDYYTLQQTEVKVLAANVSGTSASMTTSLSYPHWGVLQYATDTGMSLTPGATTLFPAGVPTTADFRAPVGNLTRNVTFTSINDFEWTNNEFGFHIMIMDLGCKVYLDGVEFLRGGQSGITGRYPVHWHLCSWTKSGIYAVDPWLGAFGTDEAVIKRCVVRDSGQRGIVIHGTDGVLCQDNIIYECKGHGVFLEDATERDTIIDGNLVGGVRPPVTSRLLMQHERAANGSENGSSAFWITNPDNTFTNNHAFDCDGAGIWFSFPFRPLNLSGAPPYGNGPGVTMQPWHVILGTVSGNTAHSTGGSPVLLRGTVTDSLGNISLALHYDPTVNEQDNTVENRIRGFLLHSMTAFKGGVGAYRNRAMFPLYQGWIVSDNFSTDFVGSTDDSLGGDEAQLKESLLIGYSLNNANEEKPPPYYYDHAMQTRCGTATYHSSFKVFNNVFINYPTVIQAGLYAGELAGSGAFKLDDYYLNPVEYGAERNSGNVMINTFPGYRSTPPTIPDRAFTLAGAIPDRHGYWGPAGNYWVYDDPFFTYGIDPGDIVDVEPAGQNQVSVPGKFFGFDEFTIDGSTPGYAFRRAIHVIRQDSSGVEVGTWDVATPPPGGILGNMRHFAAYQGGRYLLEFPDDSPPTSFGAMITGFTDPSHWVLFGFQFSGATTPTLVKYSMRNASTTGSSRRTCTSAANLAAVSAGSGDLYWQDTANNRMWIKIVGGLTWPASNPYNTDEDADLYRYMALTVD